MREILLTQGKVAIVDDEDYTKLSLHNWYVDKRGYIKTSIWNPITKKQRHLTMSRAILNAKIGSIVDYIDGNKLNNTRENLRVVTQQQNLWSQKPRKSKSGYRGVQWMPAQKKWRATITFNGKGYYLGIYSTSEDAAAVYNSKALEFFGEYARLNILKEAVN